MECRQFSQIMKRRSNGSWRHRSTEGVQTKSSIVCVGVLSERPGRPSCSPSAVEGREKSPAHSSLPVRARGGSITSQSSFASFVGLAAACRRNPGREQRISRARGPQWPPLPPPRNSDPAGGSTAISLARN